MLLSMCGCAGAQEKEKIVLALRELLPVQFPATKVQQPSMFRRASKLGPEVRVFYRRAIKVIGRFDRNSDQRTYYDYLRIKLAENASVTDDRVIRKLLNTANEELDWIQKILDDKEKQNFPPSVPI